MIPTWFIELALIFIFVIPLLALCTFFLIAAEIMSKQDEEKGEAANG